MNMHVEEHLDNDIVGMGDESEAALLLISPLPSFYLLFP